MAMLCDDCGCEAYQHEFEDMSVNWYCPHCGFKEEGEVSEVTEPATSPSEKWLDSRFSLRNDNPDESGLRSGKGPSFLSKLFGKF